MLLVVINVVIASYSLTRVLTLHIFPTVQLHHQHSLFLLVFFLPPPLLVLLFYVFGHLCWAVGFRKTVIILFHPLQNLIEAAPADHIKF